VWSVLVVSESELTANAFSSLLRRTSAVGHVGSCHPRALGTCGRLDPYPNIVVADRGSILGCYLAARETWPGACVLAIGDGQLCDVAAAAQAQARGYLCTSTAPEQIRQMLADLAAGTLFVLPADVGAAYAEWLWVTLAATRQSAGIPAPRSLSRREREVLTLLVQGMPNRQLASRLSISVETAEGHAKNVLRKAGLRNRLQLLPGVIALGARGALDQGAWVAVQWGER
jgi:DNA-binding NarL/FixJ family response regulator